MLVVVVVVDAVQGAVVAVGGGSLSLGLAHAATDLARAPQSSQSRWD